MSVNNNSVELEFNKLNISDDSNSVNKNQKNCSYCNKPFTEELWCKECDPGRMIEGWTSENSDIDKFIKDTMYNAKPVDDDNHSYFNYFLEWVPFDRFTDIKEIGEGGFAKVYSATWIDSKSYYTKQDDGSWKKNEPKPKKVALKRLNGSQNNMSAEYLNELKIHWDISKERGLGFYGMTKDPKTKEFIMIIQLVDKGSLRCILSNNFNEILWKKKIYWLLYSSIDLTNLHNLGYFHKDFHSGNILEADFMALISDFGLSGPANEQKSNDKIYGVLPYIAPEVLNGEPYTSSSDIYSFGVIMAEISSGKPPFYDKKHNLSLALEICNGLRPEFGKGTPEIYKKLAYKCMNANSNERPTAKELWDILYFWYYFIDGENYQEEEKFGYKGKEIKAIFKEANKEIPNISTSYEKISGVVYTSKAHKFNNLSKPVNSSLIKSYIYDDEKNNEDSCNSKLLDLDIPEND